MRKAHKFIASMMACWGATITPAPSLCQTPDIKMNSSEEALVNDGELIVRELTGRSEKEQCYEAVGIIDGEVDEIYKILIDFQKYSEFMPNVTSIDVLERTESTAVTNWLLTLPLKKQKKYRLSLRFLNNTDTAYIEWHKASWPGLMPNETIENTSGHWILKRNGSNSTLALYNLCTDPGYVPLGLGWIVDALSKNSIPKTIINTRQRIKDLRG